MKRSQKQSIRTNICVKANKNKQQRTKEKLRKANDTWCAEHRGYCRTRINN
jgi:hypothetical protein